MRPRSTWTRFGGSQIEHISNIRDIAVGIARHYLKIVIWSAFSQMDAGARL
jgi:hypothetical protein